MATHLDQFHDQVEFIVSVHLLYEKDNIWMFDSAQDGHLVLDHVLLEFKLNLCVKQMYWNNKEWSK